MSKKQVAVPKYRLHRASRQAVVTLAGRDHYLGPWRSLASRTEYDRLIGEWDAEEIVRPAQWTPKETRTPRKISRKWILDGWFLQDEPADRAGVSLFSYDPGLRKYRGWWFDSKGNRNKSFGEWNETSQTLSYRAELEGGLFASSSANFVDKDHHVWKVQVKDAAGKLYFDAQWNVARRSK